MRSIDEVFDTGDLSSDLLQCNVTSSSSSPSHWSTAHCQASSPPCAQMTTPPVLRSVPGPRRQSTALLLRRAAPSESRISTRLDQHLLTGPFILRVQIPEAGPLDDNLVYATVAAALAVFGYRGVDYEPETCVREP